MIFQNDPYLVVLDDVVPKHICDSIVQTYENTILNDIARVEGLTICRDADGRNLCGNCNCLRVDLMQHDNFKPYVNYIAQTLYSVVDKYKEVSGADTKQLPEKFVFENLKIKKYLPDGKQGMDSHIDVFDQGTSKRFLAFIVYLNDNFTGGQTNFIKHNIKVTPKPGRVVVFPPYWPWLHSAEPVTSGSPKYFLGSYLHYVK